MIRSTPSDGEAFVQLYSPLCISPKCMQGPGSVNMGGARKFQVYQLFAWGGGGRASGQGANVFFSLVEINVGRKWDSPKSENSIFS